MLGRGFWDKILGFLGMDQEEFSTEEGQVQPPGRLNVVDLPTARQVKMVVAAPNSFEYARNLADHLKNRRPVILNLEKLEMEEAKRILDFISGVTYAINGYTRKISNQIFLFAPNNVDISGDVIPHASEAKKEIRRLELSDRAK